MHDSRPWAAWTLIFPSGLGRRTGFPTSPENLPAASAETAVLLILDTNVLSELMRPRASEQVLGWFDAMLGPAMATTSINEA